ncbi:MAG: prolyl oligopeptidase family serine peptidase [Anaerolineales bacterium]
MGKKKYVGKRHKTTAVFKKRAELDFIVQLVLGTAATEGSAVGEVFYTTNRIDENNLDSWVKEWIATAERVEKQAEEALEKGYHLSARGAFLRMFNYLRTATYAMRYNDPEIETVIERFRSCFQRAAKLFDPPIEIISIYCDGLSLPGYFMPVDGEHSATSPTLIFIVGGESFCEEAILYAHAAARMYGYNLFTFDLPGQGVTAFEGTIYRPDVEVPMKAAIDYLVTRPDVDPEKIVGHGVSYGGYVMARSAAYEERFKGVCGSTFIVDFQQMIVDGWGFMAKMPNFAGSIALKMLGNYDPLALVAMEKFFASVGLEKPSELTTIFKDWRVDPSMVKCPAFCLIGENESEAFKNQGYAAYEGIQTTKKLRVFREEEGADSHTQGTNFPLLTHTIFNWYEDLWKDNKK